MSELTPQQILFVFLGAIAGLFPILLTAFLSWLEKRGVVARNDRILDQTRNHVEFLDTWVKVQESLCSAERLQEIKRETSVELDRLKQALAEALIEEEEAVEEEGERNIVQQWSLAYLPHNATGWLLHILFYMFLGMLILGVLGLLLVGSLLEGLIGVAFFLFPLLFIRWLAVRVDRKAEEKLAAFRAAKKLPT
jgi:hypothetical protein